MNFASDNTGPAHPKVIEAIVRANEGYAMPYGADDFMTSVREKLRKTFEAPEASVHLVATGTAANSLILATLAQPWQTVFCSQVAHVHEDECAAPEFFTGGSKLTLVECEAGKMSAEGLRTSISSEGNRGVHGPQRGPVTITQATEKGTLYSISEIKALTEVAQSFDLPVHMDGARFANAVAALGVSPAEMTWKSGVDAISFGGTKNGLLGVEAVIFFDPSKSWEFELRRKRGAHLFSKNRFLAAQMNAALEGDLWLEMARLANTATARLVRGLKQIPHVNFLFEPEANIIFAEWPRHCHKRLFEAGAQYYAMGDLEGPEDEMLAARLVTDWSASEENIDRFIELLRA